MPMPDQAPAAEEEAAEPAQDQAAEAAAGEEKDYKALYEEALAQSRFDYQSVRHCSKTTIPSTTTLVWFDYQSVRHCSKTYLFLQSRISRFDYQSVRHCSKTQECSHT